MHQKTGFYLLILFFTISNLQAQLSDKEIFHKGIESIATFRELLAIPNDAIYIEDIFNNMHWCKEALDERGFTSQILETPTRPLLYAEATGAIDKSKPTVLFYFHLDGQSVDPQFWFQDDPYNATLKKSVEGEGWVDMEWSELSKENYDPNWYIFARSTSDSKNNFIMWMTAFDLIANNGGSLPYNLKLILDFEEEKSSPSLAATVAKNKSLLAADMLVIYDGPRHISNQPTLSFGARGIAAVTLTVYGPVFAQHSGHYGNYAPNPALKLSKLLASMKDDDGVVVIPGYYDGISIDDKTKAILDAVP